MPKKRYTPEQIVAKLRQVDVALAQGQSIAQAVKAISVTETGPDRELAGSLQCRAAAFGTGLPGSSAGGAHRAGLASFGGRSAGPHAEAGAVQCAALTFKLDPFLGAGQRRRLQWAEPKRSAKRIKPTLRRAIYSTSSASVRASRMRSRSSRLFARLSAE